MRSPKEPFVPLLLLWAVLAAGAQAAAAEPKSEDFTFESSVDKTGPLIAAAVYASTPGKLPLMVVQHGYSGNRQNVAFSARRMAKRGYFCICIQPRGKGGSAGKQDDGGIEIMDIHDGIQAAIAKYPERIDPQKISIVGYSNGGANVFFSTVRFPWLFRASMAFFGIPDYGVWDYGGAVTKAVGGSVKELPDKYLVRNSTLAAGNLCGTRFHIAYDSEEGTCPPRIQEAFINAVKAVNYPDLTVHLSKPGDQNRWIHGYNSGNLDAAEDLFMDDIQKIKAPLPAMKNSGQLTVLGFIVTPRFKSFLGKGDDAAAKVKYEFSAGNAKFTFSPLTSDRKAKAAVTLVPEIADKDYDVSVNGSKFAAIKRGEPLKAEAALDAVLEFRVRK